MSSEKPYRLAVKAVIFDFQNQCLIIRRSPACRHFVGFWEWPGGKADEGEDFASALIREVREETGLEVEICGFAGATCFEMTAVYMVLLCLETRLLGGELRMSEEHDQFFWVPLSELERYSFTPGVGEFMLDYARKKVKPCLTDS